MGSCSGCGGITKFYNPLEDSSKNSLTNKSGEDTLHGTPYVTFTSVANVANTVLQKSPFVQVVSDVAGHEEKCTTVKRLVDMAYSTSVPGKGCMDDLDQVFLDYVNSVIDDLNALHKDSLPIRDGIVKRISDCEYHLPPFFSRIVGLSIQLEVCSSSCSSSEYKYIAPNNFNSITGNGVYTILEDKIIVKDRKVTCNCVKGPPGYLYVKYVSKIPYISTQDDCLKLSPFLMSILKYLLIANHIGVKFDNQLAITRALDMYRELKNSKLDRGIDDYEGPSVHLISTPTRYG